MVTRTAVVKNSAGIHLRPSGVIMKVIEQYEGRVRLSNGSSESEVDSIMTIIAFGFLPGDSVTIKVDGPNEAQMADELVTLFETHFDFPPK